MANKEKQFEIEDLEDNILSGDFDEYTLNRYVSLIKKEQEKITLEKACNEFNTFVDNVMSEKFEYYWCAAAKERFRKNMEGID